MRKLDEGLRSKLILVSAPAGFGKSAFMSEWLASCSHKTTWLSLDKGDKDPARFWTYFIAALQKLQENLGEQPLSVLHEQGQRHPTTEFFLTLLLNEIAELSDEFVLVLDDYHVVDTLEIHEGLSFLLDHLPSHMHLIVTGRSDPPLHLAPPLKIDENSLKRP
jgi:LuxR family maltose regulon positive regulatory protein